MNSESWVRTLIFFNFIFWGGVLVVTPPAGSSSEMLLSPTNLKVLAIVAQLANIILGQIITKKLSKTSAA